MEEIQIEPNGYFRYLEIPSHTAMSPNEETASGAIQTEYHVLKRLSQDPMKRMQSLGLNLQGFEHFTRGNHEHALDCFKQAVEVDPRNSNALRHCRYVYTVQGREEEAERMREEIEAVSHSENAPLIYARSLAELAMAIIATSTSAQLFFAYKSLEYAIHTAGSGITPEEEALWKLALCFSMKCLNEHIDNEYEFRVHMHKEFELLVELSRDESIDSQISASALCIIGATLQRPDSMIEKECVEEVITEKGILGGSLEVEKYIRRAYSLAPSSPHVCCAYAQYFNRCQKLHEALAKLDEALSSLDAHEHYLYLQSLRGQILLKRYLQNREIGRKQDLDEAFVLLRASPRSNRNIGRMGRILQLQLLHGGGISIDPDDETRVLSYFEKGIELQGSLQYTEVHKHHSMCLAEFGMIRKAVESHKRIIENDDLHIAKPNFMFHLIKVLMQLYDIEERPDFILSELTYWMHVTCSKYKELKDFSSTLRHLYHPNKRLMNRVYYTLKHVLQNQTAELFDQHIRNFSPRCLDPPVDFTMPPVPVTPHNRMDKKYDVFLVHSVTDRPWVYYSLITKLELTHELKSCLLGRDFMTDRHDDVREPSNQTGSQRSTKSWRGAEPRRDEERLRLQEDTEQHSEREPSIQSVSAGCSCVLIVLTHHVLQGIWFRDGRPSENLQQVISSNNNIIVLRLEKELPGDELFSEPQVNNVQGGNSIIQIDGSILAPWEKLVENIRIFCGDTEEDMEKFDVEADMRRGGFNGGNDE